MLGFGSDVLSPDRFRMSQIPDCFPFERLVTCHQLLSLILLTIWLDHCFVKLIGTWLWQPYQDRFRTSQVWDCFSFEMLLTCHQLLSSVAVASQTGLLATYLIHGSAGRVAGLGSESSSSGDGSSFFASLEKEWAWRSEDSTAKSSRKTWVLHQKYKVEYYTRNENPFCPQS